MEGPALDGLHVLKTGMPTACAIFRTLEVVKTSRPGKANGEDIQREALVVASVTDAHETPMWSREQATPHSRWSCCGSRMWWSRRNVDLLPSG